MARTKRTERAAPAPPQLQPGPPLAAEHPDDRPLPRPLPSPPGQIMPNTTIGPVGAGSPAVPGMLSAETNSHSSHGSSSKRTRKSRSSTARASAAAATATSTKNNTGKPFRCDYCHPTLFFGRKHDLKRHIDTKHLNDRPYHCPRPGCGHATNRRDHARRHFKNHPTCASYIRVHYALDQSVALAVERACGGGSDAWITELGIQRDPATGVVVYASEASTEQTHEYEGGRSGDDEEEPLMPTVDGSVNGSDYATAATGLPDPHLFFAAHAAESPAHAPLRSPFASASGTALAPQPSLSDVPPPLPFAFPSMPQSILTSSTSTIPGYHLGPQPPHHCHYTPHTFVPSPQHAAPAISTAATTGAYHLPNWLAMITNPSPSERLADEDHDPFGMMHAPNTSNSAMGEARTGPFGSVPPN